MNERKSRILEAATSLFAQYGPAKTTMNDIAREAGVARQTLYNAYPNKDEVLRAVMRMASDKMHTQVMADWGEAKGLGAKLDIYFAAGPLTWYDMAKSSPQMAELFDGLHQVAKVEMAQVGQQWVASFAHMLEAEGVPAGQCETLADYVFSTAGNAKYNADNRAVVEGRLDLLKASVLALISEGQVAE